MLKPSLLFLFFQILLAQNLFAQQEEETQRRLEIEWRSQVSMNYFSFDDQFLAGPRSLAPGLKFGAVLDWNKGKSYHFRLEPNLEYERLSNRYESRGNEARVVFNSFYAGTDIFPLFFEFGDKLPLSAGLGAFTKYNLGYSSRAELNGSSFNEADFELKKFQSGWILAAGTQIQSIWVELRYYKSFGALIEVDRTPHQVNQIAVNVIW
ncbi:porin family protein [Algoriphagus namhaensis]